MKNVVKLSLLVLMVSLPGFAFAALADGTPGSIGPSTTPVIEAAEDNDDILATTNYVKGAYNELGKAINGLKGQIDDIEVTTPDDVIDKLDVAGTSSVKAATKWGSTSDTDLEDVTVNVSVTASKKSS